MNKKYEIKKKEVLLNAQKVYVESLVDAQLIADGNEEYNIWLKNELDKATKTKNQIEQEIRDLKSETYLDNEYLKVKLDGIKAKMRVYHNALLNCSNDATEEKLLSSLVKLKKVKENLEKELQTSKEKQINKKQDHDFLDKTRTYYLNLDTAIECMDISEIADVLGIPEYQCLNELKSVVKKAYGRANMLKTSDNNMRITEMSEHFKVIVYSNDGGLYLAMSLRGDNF